MEVSRHLLQGNSDNSKPELDACPDGEPPLELQGKETYSVAPHEMPSKPMYEMGTEGRVGELRADEAVKEDSGQTMT